MQIEHNPGPGYGGSVAGRVKGIVLRVVAMLVGAALVAGAFVISVVFFAVAFAAALGVGGYLWWRTRHVRRQMRDRYQDRDIIEGTVLKSE